MTGLKCFMHKPFFVCFFRGKAPSLGSNILVGGFTNFYYCYVSNCLLVLHVYISHPLIVGNNDRGQ